MRCTFFLAWALPLATNASEIQQSEVAAVASDHALASACGAEVLEMGGNAVDAAVATALCAGVVQPAGSGLGGGGFALVSMKGAAPRVFDFREVAPSGVWVDPNHGAYCPENPACARSGGLAVAVPSEGPGLADLWLRLGRLSAPQVAAPAIALASRGFEVGAHLAGSLQSSEQPEVLAAFSKRGELVQAGLVWKRPDLAGVLRRWAATQGENLRTGPDARKIAAHVARHAGPLTASDLAHTSTVERDPITCMFEGLQVVSMPPPSSGGLLLCEMLQALDGLKPVDDPEAKLTSTHRMLEAMKHAFASRISLGDPAFVPVDEASFLGEARTQALRGDFDPTRTFSPDHYGALVQVAQDGGTQHISVLDAEGNAVALTTTINTPFGSGLVVPRLGVILNNEMDDFTTSPAAPNAFGLTQGMENRVRPGARPLSSMSPTLVLDAQGQVRLVIGASGGSTIITAVLQVMLDVLWGEQSPEVAVAQPRLHAQWLPDLVFVEPAFDAGLLRALEALGHKTAIQPGFSAVQLVERRADGSVRAASDPRKGGAPAFQHREE